MSDYQGSYISRNESPDLEAAASSAIEEAFRDLIERRHLYQKITLDFAGVDIAIKRAVEKAKERAGQPTLGAGHGSPHPVPATPERLQELHAEIETRPWDLKTRHLSDDPADAAMQRFAGSGTQPLGTPSDQMNISFYLPAVQLKCPGRCNRISTFTALGCSDRMVFGSPYPRIVKGKTEQIFTPVYRCELCRETVYTILVRRSAGRIHLSGFAPRRVPLVTKSVPESIIPILNDAEQSVAEGDIYAGMYHLRTLLEHYLKNRLGVRIEQQVRGDDLVRQHYETLAPQISSVLPPLLPAWEKLSQWLHTRTGEIKDYEAQRDAICKHIESLTVLGPGAVNDRSSGVKVDL